jgi:hypothetical protein
MSRYLNRPRHLTFADTLERPGLLEDALEADFDRELSRLEWLEDRTQAREDARERSGSWTYLGGEAA